jgi:hypothetical protein
MRTLAQSLARQQAVKKRNEEAPFRTRAQREIEALEGAKVYPHTLLRFHFPDRYVLQLQAHPRETVGNVRRVLWDEALNEEGRAAVGEEGRLVLHTTPPRRVLETSMVLEEGGMVPAAVIHVTWEGAASGVAGGRYLRAGLREGGREIGGAYPVGVALTKKAAVGAAGGEGGGGRGEGREEGGRRLGGGRGEGGGAGRKPAWMKL